jgi:hypothetical protein
MDDFLLYDRRRSLLVAVLDLRLGRIPRGGSICLSNRSHRRRLSHFIPSHCPRLIRNLGFFLARPEPSGHGSHLVRSTKLYRRYVSPNLGLQINPPSNPIIRPMRHLNDRSNLAQLPKPPQRPLSQRRRRHKKLPQFLPLLAALPPSPMVPSP